MWGNGSSNSIVDGDTFVNCQCEIAMGLIEGTRKRHR